MYKWEIIEYQLPLKFTWKIARGASQNKTIYNIKLSHGNLVSFGEVAGITSSSKLSEEQKNMLTEMGQFHPQTMDEIMAAPIPSHWKFGFSSAMIHMNCLEKKISLSQFLQQKPHPAITTSFALPILTPEEITSFYKKYELSRFSTLKLKINNEGPIEACETLAQLFQGPIRVDANEAFADHKQALNFIKNVSHLDIEFIEQPIPKGNSLENCSLKEKSPIPIMADESLQDQPLSESFRDEFHGINVKLMKAGSYQMAIKQLEQAKAWGMKTMLGCMVESSLGIAGAMSIANGVDYFDLDGFLYFVEEPHKLVTENKGILTYGQQHPLFIN